MGRLTGYPDIQLTGNLGDKNMSHNFQKFHYLLLAGLMAGMADVAEAGSVQFSTYYPAPFGMYDRLRLVPRTGLTPPCDPGTLYINNEVGNQLEVCNAAGNAWAPLSGGPWTQVGSDIYATDTTANVGIGTTAPNNRIQVQDLINFNDTTFLTALGYQAGNVNAANFNTFVGYQSGLANTSGNYNTFLGYKAGFANTSGVYNTFLGQNAGLANTSGGKNTFIGISAGDTNTIGTSNVFIGGSSGQSNFLSSYNTFLGTESGFNTTGANNTFLGYRTGLSTTTGNDNILIGYNINAPLATTSNFLNIGNAIYGDLSTGNVGIGTNAPTSPLHIKATEGDAPPGVFLENADITANGGTDGVFGLRNAGTGTTPKISIGGPGNGTEVLTVDTVARRVGIGTTSPSESLHLKNAFPSLRLERTNNANRNMVYFYPAGAVAAGNEVWGMGVPAAANYFTIGYDTDTIPPGTFALTITNAGNVGIGTTDPGTNRLEVVGGPIKATGGLIIPTCTIAAGDCPASPVNGQIWLCTDCP